VLLAAEGPAFSAGFGLDWSTLAQAAEEAGRDRVWDSVADVQMIGRYGDTFAKLHEISKPTVAAVQGWCIAGGTDMVLNVDIVVAGESARFGYPPARVWGVPTSALWAFRVGDQRAKRLLFTGDLIDGRTAHEWGLAVEAPPAAELDERFEQLIERIALTPVNQLVMMKLLVNQALYAQGLHATQALGVFFDGIARHTPEGYEFQRRASEVGFKDAVRERDQPYGSAQSPP
jgi:enoyl-CoA hydratase/carnithine racemase